MSRAIAHPNIALSKYWGKRAQGENLPAVPSLSITLAGMSTLTSVVLDARLDGDRFELGGRPAKERALARVSQLLDRLWREAGRSGARPRARVASDNDFPTAAGLASSASAFAALAVAGNAALETGLDVERLSSVARAVSASSARSLFGGFVELPAGGDGDAAVVARQVAPADHWDVRLIVAVTSEGEKAIGSTEGMLHTAATSLLYPAWVREAPRIHERVRAAVLARDLARLGPAMEQSALAMHASALAADPGAIYWNGATIETMHAVRRLRAQGIEAYFTIDAGPHVKVLTETSRAPEIARALAGVVGVLRTIVARPGEGARLLVDGEET